MKRQRYDNIKSNTQQRIMLYSHFDTTHTRPCVMYKSKVSRPIYCVCIGDDTHTTKPKKGQLINQLFINQKNSTL